MPFIAIAFIGLFFIHKTLYSDSKRGPASEEYANAVTSVEDYREGMQLRNAYFSNEKQAYYGVNFIFRTDETGLAYLATLREMKRNGVDVNIILDYYGSVSHTKTEKGRRLYPAMIQHLLDEGINIKFYNIYEGKLPWQPGKLLNRLHVKLDIFEGLGSYIVSDRNIGDSYYGLRKDSINMRSRDLLVEGDSVNSALDFYKALESDTQRVEAIDFNKLKVSLTATQINEANNLLDRSLPDKSRKVFTTKNTVSYWKKRLEKVKKLSLIFDNAAKNILQQSHQLLLSYIERAKEKVRVQSPYVILNKTNTQAIQSALNNGAKIQMITSQDVTDEVHVPPVYQYDSERLVNMGVSLHEVDGAKSGLLYHQKMATFDGHTTFIMTNNLENRSQVWDSEIAVVIEDKKFTKKMDDVFTKTLKMARTVPKGRKPLRYKSCTDFLNFIISTTLRPIL